MEIYKKRKSGATSRSDDSYGRIRSVARGPVVLSPNGTRMQSVYLPSLGENAYMDIDTDRIMSEAEVRAATGRLSSKMTLKEAVKASKESGKRSSSPSPKIRSQPREEIARARDLKHEWEKSIVLGKSKDDFARYEAIKKFEAGQLVRHSKFGKGVIRRASDSDRVEILFEDGVRTLPQNMPPREKRPLHWDTK